MYWSDLFLFCFFSREKVLIVSQMKMFFQCKDKSFTVFPGLLVFPATVEHSLFCWNTRPFNSSCHKVLYHVFWPILRGKTSCVLVSSSVSRYLAVTALITHVTIPSNFYRYYSDWNINYSLSLSNLVSVHKKYIGFIATHKVDS